VFTFEEIDATALMEARRELNTEFEPQGQRISFLPFFVKACVIALHEHPRFNASINMAEETINYHDHCNIGIATATPEGLIVTVVHHAEQKSIVEIGNEIITLAALARERRVTVDNGEPAVRNILPLAVSTDHRLNDGEHLGGFVSTLCRLLGNPVRMLGHL